MEDNEYINYTNKYLRLLIVLADRKKGRASPYLYTLYSSRSYSCREHPQFLGLLAPPTTRCFARQLKRRRGARRFTLYPLSQVAS